MYSFDWEVLKKKWLMDKNDRKTVNLTENKATRRKRGKMKLIKVKKRG